LPDQSCEGRPINTDFVLNQSRYDGCNILLSRANFGCGSSREHAPWALDDYGFRAVIAPSYADIFFNNCFKNGILPIVLSEEIVDVLFSEVASTVGYQLTIDLEQQVVIKPSGETIPFQIDEFRRHCLLNGLDDIGLTLEDSEQIKAFEQQWQQKSPWMFG
jgi:3-isopropylmalate/(R)-2-methylmalate dehydratase small subunit